MDLLSYLLQARWIACRCRIGGCAQFRPNMEGKTILVCELVPVGGHPGSHFCLFSFAWKKKVWGICFGFPLVSLGYGMLVLSAICPKGLLFKKGSLVTAQLATLSYAIYLSHKFVIHVTQDIVSRVGVAADSNSMFIICITTSLSVAC